MSNSSSENTDVRNINNSESVESDGYPHVDSTAVTDVNVARYNEYQGSGKKHGAHKFLGTSPTLHGAGNTGLNLLGMLSPVFATIALAVLLNSFALLSVPFAAAGLVVGAVGLKRARSLMGVGKIYSITGIVASIVALVIALLVYVL